MTPNEYQELAMRTCGQSNFIDMIVNAGLSLSEETSELIETLYYSEANILTRDEIGDACWYVAELCQALEWSMDDIIDPPVLDSFSFRDAVDLLVIYTGKIAGLTKKYVFHQHELDKKVMKSYLHDVMCYIALLCAYQGFTLEDVMIANIDKLKKRYPSGFSSEMSRNRK